MQITYEQSAYLETKFHSINEVRDGATGAVMLSHIQGSKYFEGEGYVRIGTATVVLTLFPQDEVQRKELEALNEQLRETRAENQRRENAILDRISKLQALTFETA